MIQFDDKTAEALEYVRKAEKIMAKLGYTKYSLSGMCSAAMRHDLEKEVCELLDELAEARKQRDMLAKICAGIEQAYLEGSDSEWGNALMDIRLALAAVKGGEA
jgi:hypothetical protein